MSELEYPVPLGRVFLHKGGPSPDERLYVNSLIELIDHKYQAHDLAVFGRRPGWIERERIWPNDHTIDWAGHPTDTEDYCSVGAFRRGLENWCGPRKRADIDDVFVDLVISRDDWISIVKEIKLRGFRDLRNEEHAPTRDEQLSSLATYLTSQVLSPAGSTAHERLSTKINQLKKALEAYGRKPDIAASAVIKWLKNRELALHISIDGKVRPEASPPAASFWSTPQAKRASITDVVPTKYLDVKAGIAMVVGAEFDDLARDEFPGIGWPFVAQQAAVTSPGNQPKSPSRRAPYKHDLANYIARKGALPWLENRANNDVAGLYLEDIQRRRATLKEWETLKRAKPDEKLPRGFQHPPSDEELPRANNRKTRIGNIVQNIREQLIRSRQQSSAAQDKVE